MNLDQSAAMESFPGKEPEGMEYYDSPTLISQWKEASPEEKKACEKEMKRRSLDHPTVREQIFYHTYKVHQPVTVYFLEGSPAFTRYGPSVKIEKLHMSRFEIYELQTSLNQVMNQDSGRHDVLRARSASDKGKKRPVSPLAKEGFHTADVAFFE